MDVAAWSSDKCDRCHWREGTPKPGPFDHGTTGRPLSRFHQGKSCRVCHKEVPFAGLTRNCDDCHGDWSPSAFDHAVTGQQLDENHADQECEVCHLEGRFDRPPACSECHDQEDDGIAFPAKRPGPFVGSGPGGRTSKGDR
jgi:hypothetical protein